MSVTTHGNRAMSAAAPTQARACHHEPRCPAALAGDRLAARVVAAHPEQGWSLLCNGVIAFDDGGAIMPSPPRSRAGLPATRDAA
jgi:hypothetical protein